MASLTSEQKYLAAKVESLSHELSCAINASDIMYIVQIMNTLIAMAPELPSSYNAKIYVLDRYLLIKKGSVNLTHKCKRV